MSVAEWWTKFLNGRGSVYKLAFLKELFGCFKLNKMKKKYYNTITKKSLSEIILFI